MAEAWIAMIELAASTIEATFATLRVCTQAPGRSLSTRGVLVDVRIWIHTAPASATRRPLSKPSLHCHSACARRRSDHPARACAYSRFVVPPLIESRSLVNNTACASERPCVLGGSSLEAEGFLVGGESGAKLARLAVAAALVETSTGREARRGCGRFHHLEHLGNRTIEVAERLERTNESRTGLTPGSVVSGERERALEVLACRGRGRGRVDRTTRRGALGEQHCNREVCQRRCIGPAADAAVVEGTQHVDGLGGATEGVVRLRMRR